MQTERYLEMKAYNEIIESLETCAYRYKNVKCSGCMYKNRLDVDPTCDELLMQKAAEALKELTERNEDDLK